MSETATDNKKALDKAKTDLNDAAGTIKTEVVDVEYDGYKFKVDTALLDDVDALEMIDKIENENNMKAVVDFLQYLVGPKGYDKMKAHFVKKDGRFKISTLSKIYIAIFDQFDPKD